MDLGKAIKGGKAVYADGEHEAVVEFNGVTPDGKNAFDIHEHTKGVGHVTGVCLNARETVRLSSSAVYQRIVVGSTRQRSSLWGAMTLSQVER